MNELRLIRRAAGSLALLALLVAALALHTLHAERDAGTPLAGPASPGVAPIVTALRPGGAADRAGLRVVDVVERIDGRIPKSIADAKGAMASGRPTDVMIRQDGHIIDLALE